MLAVGVVTSVLVSGFILVVWLAVHTRLHGDRRLPALERAGHGAEAFLVVAGVCCARLAFGALGAAVYGGSVSVWAAWRNAWWLRARLLRGSNVLGLRLARPRGRRALAFDRASVAWTRSRTAAEDAGWTAGVAWCLLIAVLSVWVAAVSCGKPWSSAVLWLVAAYEVTVLAQGRHREARVREKWRAERLGRRVARPAMSRLVCPSTSTLPRLYSIHGMCVGAAARVRRATTELDRPAGRKLVAGRRSNRSCLGLPWGRLAGLLVLLVLLLSSAHGHAETPLAQMDAISWETPFLEAGASLKGVAAAGGSGLRAMLVNVQRKMSSDRSESSSPQQVGESVQAVVADAKRHGAHVMMLSETDHRNPAVHHLHYSFDKEGFKSFWSHMPRPARDRTWKDKGHRGCALIICKKWLDHRPVRCKKLWRHSGGRGVMAAVQQVDGTWLHLISLYAPSNAGNIAGSFERKQAASIASWLRARLREVNGKQVLVGGDLNAVLRRVDRRSKRLNQYDKSKDALPRILSESGYLDMSATRWGDREVYTQHCSNAGAQATSRIDQLHASRALRQRSPDLLTHSFVGVDRVSAVVSTHHPVVAWLACDSGSGGQSAAPPRPPRIKYSRFDKKAQAQYASHFLTDEALQAAQSRTADAQHAVHAYTDSLRTVADRNAAKKALGDVWKSWADAICEALSAITPSAKKGKVTRAECDAMRAITRATRARRQLQAALRWRRDHGMRWGGRVPASVLRRVAHQIKQLNRWGSAAEVVPAPRSSSWEAFKTYVSDADDACVRVKKWARRKKGQWITEKIKGATKARRKCMFTSRLRRVIAGAFQCQRVPKVLANVPTVTHHDHKECGPACQAGCGDCSRRWSSLAAPDGAPTDHDACTVCKEPDETFCACPPNGMSNNPAKVKERVRDHFWRWTMSTKEAPESEVAVERHPDGNHYRIKAYSCTCPEGAHTLDCRRMRALQPLDGQDGRRLVPTTVWRDMDKLMTAKTWRRTLAAFDTGKAGGPDQVRIEAVRALPFAVQTEVMQLMNCILSENLVPDYMLEATMAPLHKKASKPYGLANIRPISLCMVPLKLMSKFHMHGVNAALAKHGSVLSPMQNAFCPGRGVAAPLLANELVNEDAQRRGRVAWSCYCDVSKAYDSVEFYAQEVALRRLRMPEFFIDYMRAISRTGSTRVQTMFGLTDPYHIERGVRQGEVLSPFVFNAVMDPIAELMQQSQPYRAQLGTTVHGCFFADDIWAVSGRREGIVDKVQVIAHYLGYAGMSLNTEKTHFTANTDAEVAPIPVEIWKKGWTKGSSRVSAGLIDFQSTMIPVRYLGVMFTGAGCRAASYAAMNAQFQAAIQKLYDRNMSFAELSYTIQAVVFARLGYIMTVAIPPDKDVKRWQSQVNALLAKALRSQGIPRAVFAASRRAGGMGCKTIAQIRDEVVLTTVLSLLNESGSVTGGLLQEAFTIGDSPKVYGCTVNSRPAGTQWYADRFRGLLHGLDYSLVRRDADGLAPRGPVPRVALDLERESPAHRSLRRQGMREIRDVVSSNGLIWKPRVTGDGGDGLVLARSGIAAPLTARLSGPWAVSRDHELTQFVREPYSTQGAEAGEVLPGLGWVTADVVCTRDPVDRARPRTSEWWTDGSLKPRGGRSDVGWSAVQGTSGANPGDHAQVEAASISGPLGDVGVDEPTIGTAESYAILQAISASPWDNDRKIDIATDSRACTLTFESLERLTSRKWTRLPNRWIWRMILAQVLARRAVGQEVGVRWIRAHTEGEDNDSLWNDQADRIAKAAADMAPPVAVALPPSERRWVVMHERRAITSDVTAYTGRIHALRATAVLNNGRWLPLDLNGVDTVALEHVVKASDGVDLQVRAARLWTLDGLRTVRKLVQWNPNSLLAEVNEGVQPCCPLCDAECADSLHVLAHCPAAAETRGEAVASFYSECASYGRWGWWGGLAARAQEKRNCTRDARRWMKSAGVHGSVQVKNGVPFVTLRGTSLPLRVWQSLHTTVGAASMHGPAGEWRRAALSDKKVNARIARGDKAAEEGRVIGLVQLPPAIAKAVMAVFSIKVDANACVASNRIPPHTAGAQYEQPGGFPRELVEVAGQQSWVRCSGVPPSSLLKRIELAWERLTPMRVIMVLHGPEHAAGLATVVKRHAKVLVTWPPGSIEFFTGKHVVDGYGGSRKRTSCSPHPVSLVMWENSACREHCPAQGAHWAAAHDAMRRHVRGKAARLQLRYHDSQGQRGPPHFPVALRMVDVGFDQTQLDEAQRIYGTHREMAWGLPDHGAALPDHAVYRGLLGTGLTALAAAAGVGASDRREMVNSLAAGLVENMWRVWLAYETLQNDWLKDQGLAIPKKRGEKPRNRVPPETVERRSKAAVVAALTPFFGLSAAVGSPNGEGVDPVCKEASRRSLGEVMRSVEAAVDSGRLRSAISCGGGQREVQITYDRVRVFMREHGIKPAPDPEWRAGRRPKRRAGARMTHRRGQRALTDGTGQWRTRRKRTEEYQAWSQTREDPQQPGRRYTGVSETLPVRKAGRERLHEWNGTQGSVSVERRDMGFQAGPPPYSDGRWVGFTWSTRRSGHLTLLGNREEGGEFRAVSWRTGATRLVMPADVHCAWVAQRAGMGYCSCDECRPEQERELDVLEREPDVEAKAGSGAVGGRGTLHRYFLAPKKRKVVTRGRVVAVQSDIRDAFGRQARLALMSQPGDSSEEGDGSDSETDGEGDTCLLYRWCHRHDHDCSVCHVAGDIGRPGSTTLHLCLTCRAAVHLECLTPSERAWVDDDAWMCDECCAEQARRAVRMAAIAAQRAADEAARCARGAARSAWGKRLRRRTQRLVQSERSGGRTVQRPSHADAAREDRQAANAWLVGKVVSLPRAWGSVCGKVLVYEVDADRFRIMWRGSRERSSHTADEVRGWYAENANGVERQLLRDNPPALEAPVTSQTAVLAGAVRRAGELLCSQREDPLLERIASFMERRTLGCLRCARRCCLATSLLGHQCMGTLGARMGRVVDYVPEVDQVVVEWDEGGSVAVSRAEGWHWIRATIFGHWARQRGDQVQALLDRIAPIGSCGCGHSPRRAREALWERLGLSPGPAGLERAERRSLVSLAEEAARSVGGLMDFVGQALCVPSLQHECDLCFVRAWAMAPLVRTTISALAGMRLDEPSLEGEVSGFFPSRMSDAWSQHWVIRRAVTGEAFGVCSQQLIGHLLDADDATCSAVRAASLAHGRWIMIRDLRDTAAGCGCSGALASEKRGLTAEERFWNHLPGRVCNIIKGGRGWGPGFKKQGEPGSVDPDDVR